MFFLLSLTRKILRYPLCTVLFVISYVLHDVHGVGCMCLFLYKNNLLISRYLSFIYLMVVPTGDILLAARYDFKIVVNVD